MIAALPAAELSVTWPLLTNRPPATIANWPLSSRSAAVKLPSAAWAGVEMNVRLPPLKYSGDVPTLVNRGRCRRRAGVERQRAVGLEVRDVHLAVRADRDRPAALVDESVEDGRASEARGDRQSAAVTKVLKCSSSRLANDRTVVGRYAGQRWRRP